jgi:enoyl-CoA hydratase
MRFDDYRSIEFERRERVLVVKLNRPEQLNAVDAGLHAELARVFGDVQRDPDSDVVVLTGNGRAFCAGGDLAWMQSAIDRPEEFERTAREAKDIVFSQLDLEKPLIARLNGHAIGLGASLALLSDVIVAHEGVKIGDPHVSVGLVAGDGGALIWPQLCGHAKARKYGLAARLAAGATRAIRWTKLTTNLPLRQLFHACFDTGIAYEMPSNATRDHAEAVAAFRDRRPPRFGR